MKRILTILLLAAPLSIAAAEEAKPKPPAAKFDGEVRLVPALKDGKPQGLKMYAIKAGGRLARAGFKNGDTLVKVDGKVTTDALAEPAVREVIIEGVRGGACEVLRANKSVTITLEKK